MPTYVRTMQIHEYGLISTMDFFMFMQGNTQERDREREAYGERERERLCVCMSASIRTCVGLDECICMHVVCRCMYMCIMYVYHTQFSQMWPAVAKRFIAGHRAKVKVSPEFLLD